MNSIDQDGRKRRKLSLSNKTQSRLRGSHRLVAKPLTPKSGHIPIPKKSLRTLRGPAQNVDSSDESSLEIGWDNNSPSPSTCTKPGRRNGRKNDIAAILKKVPKKKKIDAKDWRQSDGTFNTWMQNDLAICTNPGDNLKGSNRKSQNRSQKRGAKTLHEEIKNFIEKVVHSEECETTTPVLGSTPQRKSPQRSCPSKASPSLANVSPIVGKLYASPVHLPLHASPVTTPVCRGSAITSVGRGSAIIPVCKDPVDSPLVLENFDNINWSYLDTPAVKISCQTDKNENLLVDITKSKAFPCKTLYKKDNDEDDDKKSPSCKMLYNTKSVHTRSTATASEILHNTHPVPCEISLTNIDLGDTMEEIEPDMHFSIPDTIVVNNPSSDKPGGHTKLDNGKCSQTAELKITPLDSLVNIDFDDDLDEILSSQPLDQRKVETDPKTESKIVTTNGHGICTRDNTDVSMTEDEVTRELPITENRDYNMLSEDPLSEDDNFSDVLIHLDNNKKTIETYNCNKSPTVESEDTALDQTAKVVTVHTPNRKQSQIDIIEFDDADDLFDDIIVSLDGVVKCKSQETPPQSITSDQRKMKSRCHTSPFPLSSKRTLLQCDNSLGTTKNGVGKNSVNNQLNFGKENLFNETIDLLQLDKKQNLMKGSETEVQKLPQKEETDFPVSSSFKENENSSLCRKSNVRNKISLDISSIGEPPANKMEDDVKMDTLTQKCSFDEIQRKRELAQSKLKERNRWKK